MAIEFVTTLDAAGVSRKIAVDQFNTDFYAQITKLGFSDDGNAPVQVGPSNPFPVTVATALPAGTANIGDVDVLTVPAMDRTVDSAAVALQTGAIMLGNTVLVPTYGVISAAATPNNTLLAAQTGKKIRVISLFAAAAGTVNATFQSGAAGTALTGAIPFVANAGVVLPFNPAGWFETAASTLLNLSLSAAIGVYGAFTWIGV